MPRILTVDDSRTIRTLVRRQALLMGFEVEEAEDGEQGLIKLAEGAFDLMILDVTMPVLDGPGMLAQARARGDKTPVLMLTSESRSEVIVGLMKLGIGDYILKPFTPEHIADKITKILKLDANAVRALRETAEAAATAAAGGEPAPAAVPVTTATAPAAPAPKPEGRSDGKPTIDLLVVDDMENVEKRLRALMPDGVTMEGARTAEAAILLCRKRVYRVVLMDSDIPNVDSVSLMKQLRLLLPEAAFHWLTLRSVVKAQDKARAQGFVGVLFKPFDQDSIDDFLDRYFDNQELVTRDENVVRLTPFRGREIRQDGYFVRLEKIIAACADTVADECFEQLILDVSGLPTRPDKTARMIMEIVGRTKRLGLKLRLVGPPEVKRGLSELAETAGMAVFGSVTEARASSGP